jgi:hypothetical protein
MEGTLHSASTGASRASTRLDRRHDRWLVAEIGRRLLPETQTRTSFAELLRTIGFAATPGLFQIFAAMPSLTAPVFGVTAVRMLVAMVIAVRQALDYRDTARALAVCAVGWTLALVRLGAAPVTDAARRRQPGAA